MIIVSNASPLIILAKISYFHLPQRLFNEIAISEDVWDEVAIKGAGLPGSTETRAGQPIWVDSCRTVSEFSAVDHLAKLVFVSFRRAGIPVHRKIIFDELGRIFQDQDFADLYSQHGQPWRPPLSQY